MGIQIIVTLLAGLILMLMAVFIWSFIRTTAGTRYDLSFYERDKAYQPGAVVKRRYQNAGHLLYRLIDTLRYAYPILRVYLLRALSPKFREKIMITTATANSCPQ